MAEYYIRQDLHERFTVTKFIGEQPDKVYHLFKRHRGWHCDCPAGQMGKPCKHKVMMDQFDLAGRPVPFCLEAE